MFYGTRKPVWPFQLNRDSQQADGLVGWWPGAPGRGSRSYDLSGYGRHGDFTSFSWDGNGYDYGVDGGRAVRHNAANLTRIEIPAISQIHNVTRLTISGWLRRQTAATTVSIGAYSDNENRVLILLYEDNNLYLSVANGAFHFGVSALSDTNWHQITLVFDGSQSTDATRIKGYVDGQLISQSYPFGTTSVSSSVLVPLKIGTVRTEWPASGYTDDCRIYNRALSDAEVAALYNPKTRWELRYQTGIRLTVGVSNAASSTQPPRSMHQYRARRVA